MANKLIIVESPTKARTIYGYLRGEYKVLASKGHVKDLPEKEFGVDIERGFRPRYVIIRGKSKVLKEIQKASKDAEMIYLASDPDREGEAIAYHIAEEIKKVRGNGHIKRILLYEITRDSVRQALQEPGEIDLNKVYAQQARRILDRIVGYQVSPILWKVMYRGLSAGRVQTVALRMLVEREKEIEAFVPEKYWLLFAVFEKDGVQFRAQLAKLDGKEAKRLSDPELAKRLQESFKKTPFQVIQKTVTRQFLSPPPPYKTSTLQQDANNKLRYSAKRTMMLAQQLYEGIEIPGIGTKGLITYMRTDSVRMADKAIHALRSVIQKTWGDAYLHPKKRTYEDRGKKIQGAHEAIRPTDPSLTPESLQGKIPQDLWKLYNLIWKRAVATQASRAKMETQTVVFKANGSEWIAEGKQLLFDGFYRILGDSPKETPLPDLQEGETLTPVKIILEERETEPPRRYTEATLVRALEAKGIGRPSTYAPTIATLKERKYVETRGRYLVPTSLGRTVVDILIPRFPEIFDYNFTAKMEEALDQIEMGERGWQEVLKDFYREFKKELEKVTGELSELKKNLQEETEETCPLCGAPLVIKWGKYGRFLACTNFPKCTYTRGLDEEVFAGEKCPVCGKDMVIRTGRHGRYLACVDYPTCPGTKPLPTGVQCPQCGSPIIERVSKKGKVYYPCSNPQCDFVVFQRPIPVPCPECGHPFVVESRTRRGLRYRCPECKADVTAHVKKALASTASGSPKSP